MRKWAKVGGGSEVGRWGNLEGRQGALFITFHGRGKQCCDKPFDKRPFQLYQPTLNETFEENMLLSLKSMYNCITELISENLCVYSWKH